MMNFEPRRRAAVGEDAAHRRVLDFRNVADQLDLGINDTRAMLEDGGRGATAVVEILVVCRAYPPPAVLAEPGWIIRPAAKQRDAERGAADDHACDPVTV